MAGCVPVALAGCIETGAFGATPDRTVVDTTFELMGSGDAMDLADEARVEWPPDDDQIVITGFIWYGSSSCNGPEFGGVTYDRDADELTVVTTFGQRTPQPTTNLQGERECTADLVGSMYTVRVTFDGGLPKHVTVKQFHNGHDSTVTNATR
ncbi:MAG: hypothetical protein R3324_07170 [Halobacteriales archaeon]|nr:hypothetical protein [Halobacteriales archaeon]